MNFNFGEVLTRAWQIIWKHKVLWIFGVLASCGRSGSNFNSNSSSGGDGGGFDSTTGLPPQVLQWLQTIQENLTAFIAVGIALICLIWIVTLFLSTIGRIGLIRGTAQVDGGAESLIFGQLFSESIPYFWRMFGLSLIVGIPFLIVLAALIGGLAVFAVSMNGGSEAGAFGVLAMVPVFIGCVCLLIPVGIVVGLILRQSGNAIILEDMKVLPSLTRGWEVFRGNLGPILLMAIILAIIGAVVGFVVAIPVFIVVVPAGIAFALGEAQNWTPMILAGVCLCLYFPILLVLNGIVTAYTESAWTLTYMRLTKPQENTPVLPEANA